MRLMRCLDHKNSELFALKKANGYHYNRLGYLINIFLERYYITKIIARYVKKIKIPPFL